MAGVWTMKLVTTALAVLALFSFNWAEGQRLRSSFGERCNSFLRCDSKQNLACRENICECIMPATMTFDSERESCAVLVGEKCLFTTVEVRNDGEDDSGEVQEKIWKEELPCVTDAACSPSSGYCNCIITHKETNNGTCEPKLTRGMKCSLNSECRSDLFLICDGGKCICNQTLIYDDNLARCVSRAGESCAETQACPANSDCESVNWDGLWKCICNKGYFPSEPEGICKRKPGHGMPCKVEVGCLEDSDLICRNATCQCKNSTVYDPDQKICAVAAGSYCVSSYYDSVNSIEKSCIKNSRCIEAEQVYESDTGGFYYKHICKCSSNYFQTEEGTCEGKRGLNEPCLKDEHCRTDSLRLSCRSGLCQCNEGNGHMTLYDPYKRQCVCPSNDEYCPYNSCGSNAFHYGGECECVERYSVGQDGICYPTHKTACSSNPDKPPCNIDEGLICVNKKCDCRLREHEYFSNEPSKRCYTYVKGPCGSDFNGSVCTPNAECVDVGNAFLQCQCKSGFLPVDGKCEFAYGKPCNLNDDTTEPFCDRIGELNCIEGVCKCDVFQSYNQAELRCRGLVGSVCHLDKENFCVDGAMCKQLRHFESRNRGVCQCKEDFSVGDDRICSALKSKDQDFPEEKNSTESYADEADASIHILPKLTMSDLKIDN